MNKVKYHIEKFNFDKLKIKFYWKNKIITQNIFSTFFFIIFLFSFFLKNNFNFFLFIYAYL